MGTCRKVRSAFARSGGLFTGTAREHQGADLGAGIKVKVLEAMSSGIPLVANGVAMEGINATAGRDYLHAETAEEFKDAIEMLFKYPKRAQEIGDCGRRFFEKNFDCEASYQRYRARLMQEIGR